MDGMSLAVHLTSLVVFLILGVFYIREQNRREFVLKLLVHYRGDGGVFLDDPYTFMRRFAEAFKIPSDIPSSSSSAVKRIDPTGVVKFLLRHKVVMIHRPEVASEVQSHIRPLHKGVECHEKFVEEL